MKVVAMVPIKLNSQRLPHKNILPILNKPLCYHICQTLSQIEQIDDVCVYCSNDEVKKYLPSNVEYVQRPSYLDGDVIKGKQIYTEFIDSIDADIYILAHTTSPFIKKQTIENALNKVLSGEFDSAFSAEKIQTFCWYDGHPLNYQLNDIPRTQDIMPIWVETSAFYIFKKEIFTKYGRRIGFKPYIQEVEGIETVDIDTKKDYEFAVQMSETLKEN